MKRKTKVTTKTISNKLLKLKPHLEKIIILSYRFCFLNSEHSQKLLNHKYPERIRTWLNLLSNQKYLKREYTKNFAGVHAVFSLGNMGRKYFLEHPEIEDINKQVLDRVWKKYSLRLKKHCMFLAEIYISLLTLMKNAEGGKGKLKFFTKVDLKGVAYLINKEPDCYFSIEHVDGTTQRYFLDIFDDHRFVLLEMQHRVRKYISYFEKEYWQDNMSCPFPEIILICPDNASKTFLNGFIKKRLDEKDLEISFYLSTWEEIKHQGICSQTLQRVKRTDN